MNTNNLGKASVCFQPYGLAFSENVVRSEGGNSIFYIDTTNQKVHAALDAIPVSPLCQAIQPIMPLIEGFGLPWFHSSFGSSEVDFRWSESGEWSATSILK